MKNNKKYTQPKITAVDLDPSQAILQACKVGAGIYMIDLTWRLCVVAGAAIFPCNSTQKGASFAGANGTISTNAEPS
ncbi:MAG: hypothetical protein PHQ52_08335 [Candidatus Omnitrophica bacterium]|nr:hypothetical protein [Candidatus Omnitrophota bacterium]